MKGTRKFLWAWLNFYKVENINFKNEMSKYSVYIIIALLGAVIAFSAWQIMAGPDFSEKRSGVLFPETKQENIDIRIDMNQSVYHSHDEVEMNIIINGSEDVKNLMVEVSGVKDRYGEEYIKEKKEISLEKGKEVSLKIIKQLPECSTCAGFKEGEYQIDVEVLKESYAVAKSNVKFNFLP